MNGIWNSTFGPIRLLQNEDRIHGVYRDLGVIEARIVQNRIEGTFTNTGDVGRCIWLLSDDRKEFFGRWAWGKTGALRMPDIDAVVEADEWVGHQSAGKVTTEAASGRPWQGEWDSDFGLLHLVQNGSRLYGLYRDLGIIEGTISGRIVTGRFTNTGEEGWFSFTLSTDGTAFSGRYGWRGNDDVGAWDGTRRGPAITAAPHRFEISSILAPYAPGETRLLVEYQPVGTPRGYPTVRLIAAEDARILRSNPIETEASRFNTGPDGKISAVITLPVADPGREQAGHLRMAKPVVGRVEISTGDQLTDSRDIRFTMPDPIIVANVGDSYGAGVGTGRYDLSAAGKRSSHSGQHRAMMALAGTAPTLLMNHAYSGKKLVPSIVEKDGTPGNQIRAVIDQVNRWKEEGLIRTARVDYLIVSAGGNDMHEDGLSGLVKRLMISVLDPSTSVFFRSLRRDLTAAQSRFAAHLNAFHRLLSSNRTLGETEVIYCTYPDLSRNEEGKFDRPPRNALPSTNRIVTTLSAKDMKFAYERVISPLNTLIREWRSKDRGRYVVNDVEARSRRHGYPSTQSWFVRARFAEGGLSQDNLMIFDAFHPSVTGHDKIYYQTLRRLLTPPKMRVSGQRKLQTHLAL